MPQFIAIAAIGAGLIAGARWARRAMLNREVHRQQAEHKRRGDTARTMGDLTADPENGVYRAK
jgi:hypothetical protein